MTFREAIRSGFYNYAKFSGRAAPSEFWYWVLFTIVTAFVAGIVDALLFPSMAHVSPIADVFSLFVFVPNISVMVRRLHDTDRSGWWALLGLVPLIGLILIVWCIEQGSAGSNRFGPSPPHDRFV
jgi:uncharacterized membrane protein YhaH (DUF805 family)